MYIRTEHYKCIAANTPFKLIADVDAEVATILSTLQDVEQKRRDRKVPVRELVSDIIKGFVVVPKRNGGRH
ncbi:hypothetical protein [Biformimicrobium ophioploci]|uniref:Uncharacterized protein n=1 Tax=Biformimicrobium ophioploci TaxID=3036711 RepID=A0ABQ6LY49_9GAMM|nr:hypothetical protein [Microbulbifer sp. NKW57]GMG86971.1 hypothetical protein MNKW57_12920 [Microbulbifer sp. NKW57]